MEMEMEMQKFEFLFQLRGCDIISEYRDISNLCLPIIIGCLFPCAETS